jgi:prolyl 4-hydroxylase
MATKVRVFLYRGFLSEEECDHLISLRKETTEVYSVDADGKTQLDPVVAGIEEKVSAWTFLPGENGGSIKVRSYTSEKSGKKLDYFGEEPSSVLHESLLATVVLYLSNTTQGGELLFPNSEVSLISNLRGKKMTFIWHTTMNVEFSFFSR